MSDAETQNVPKLRFQDFSGDWELSRTGDSFDSRRERGEASLPIYSVTLDRGLVKRDELERQIAADAADESNLKAHEGDLVYNMMRMWQGAVGRAPENCMVSPAYVVLAPRIETESRFFDYWFKSHRALHLLWAYSHGLTNDRLRLYPGDFARIPQRCPRYHEQRKIAVFLGAVDKKIAQLERKKALLEDYKTGCMQQLFSQAIRFKDDQGRDFPDWEEKRLGDVLEWVKTNSLSRDQLSYDDGAIQNIHYGDIHTKFRANFRQGQEVVPFIAPSEGTSPVLLAEYCELGDIVIADASEDYADIGKAIEITELTEIPLVAGLHTHLARPNGEELAIGFTGYMLRSPKLRRQIMRIAQGISVLGISKKNLEKLMLERPHPDEQRKIADFLSALDAKIALVVQELTLAQRFKKGLLQQMFV